MLDIVSLIAPVFGLIGLGFAAAKRELLETGAARVLAAFGYRVAMPALLFRAMANVGDVPASPLWLAAAYASGIAVTWVVVTLGAQLAGRSADEAPALAMGACFSNGVMLGFPVILLTLGPEAATPMAFLATCETVFLWLAGTAHMGLVARGSEAGIRAIGHVLRDVATNPLILALAAGLMWRVTGMAMPVPLSRLVDLVAATAVPVSLFALGMSLASYKMQGGSTVVATLCFVKLVLYPALAYWLATVAFELPRIWAGALVIYVSMPIGANAFIFATRYERAVATISAAIALSTVLSIASVTIILAALKASGVVVPL